MVKLDTAEAGFLCYRVSPPFSLSMVRWRLLSEDSSLGHSKNRDSSHKRRGTIVVRARLSEIGRIRMYITRKMDELVSIKSGGNKTLMMKNIIVIIDDTIFRQSHHLLPLWP